MMRTGGRRKIPDDHKSQAHFLKCCSHHDDMKRIGIPSKWGRYGRANISFLFFEDRGLSMGLM